MPGYYVPYKIFTPGEILTAADENASHQQHVQYNTLVAAQGYSETLEQSRIQVESTTLALTGADEIARLREKIRLLGGTTYWDQVLGPVPNPAMPKAQILLPLSGAILPDGTTGNAFPTAVERVSSQAPPAMTPKIVDIVYDFDPTTPQYIMWQITTPLGYTPGGLVEFVLKFSMMDGVSTGNFRPLVGLAPVRDGINNTGFQVTNAAMNGPDNTPVPPIFGAIHEYRIQAVVSNIISGQKCTVVVGVYPATLSNATGRRRLENASIEFSRGAFVLAAPGMPNPMTQLGDVIVGGSSGSPARLAIGSVNQVLTVEAGTPKWKNPVVGFTNPMTAPGDIIQGGLAGAASRLPIGLTGRVLTVVSGAPSWQTPTTGMSNPMSILGDIITGDVGGAPVRLAAGAEGQVLAVMSGIPGWKSVLANPMTQPEDMIVAGLSGTPLRLGIGTELQVLTVVGGVVMWQTPPFGGMTNPMTDPGDVIFGGVAGLPQRLAVGAEDEVLTVVGGTPVWAPAMGDGGDMDNPMIQAWDLIVGAVGGAPARLGIGADGNFLKIQSGQVLWSTLPVDPGFANPMTSIGDVIVGGVSGAPTRLAAGINGHVLTLAAGTPTWQATVGATAIVVSLPLEGARFPDGTPNNAFPQPVERVSTGTPSPAYSPKPVTLVYQFDATTLEWLLWKTMIPLGWVGGQVHVVVKWSMVSAITGNVALITFHGPIIDGSTDVRSFVLASTGSQSEVSVPGTLGHQKETRIGPLNTSGWVAGRVLHVTLCLGTAGVSNATGDRILEACWLEFAR